MTTFQPAIVPGEAPPPDSVRPRDSTAQAPTSVARLNDTIRGFVQTWGSVWVEGEITGWNQRGGNVFGRLKDLVTDATVGRGSCVARTLGGAAIDASVATQLDRLVRELMPDGREPAP